MKAANFFTWMLAAALLVRQDAAAVCPPPEPMGTAFTYQGFLTCTNSGSQTVIVDGDIDLKFELFDCDVAGVQKGPTLLFTGADAIAVDAGSFTVALDFPALGFPNVYNGDKRWLEITILTPPSSCAGTGEVVLSPRQELTPTPYAIFAGKGASLADEDWDISSNSPHMFAIPPENDPPGNVGIGIMTPDARLHVDEAISVTGNSAAKVTFRNIGETGTRGISVESDPLELKGSQIGVIANTSKTAGPDLQRGAAQGLLAQVSAAFSRGNMIGVSGLSTPNALSSIDTRVSFGVGGHFVAKPNDTLTLNATGTYWVGGVYAEVGETINFTPALGAVAAIIGVDKNNDGIDNDGNAQSFAGYFDGKVLVTDLPLGGTALLSADAAGILHRNPGGITLGALVQGSTDTITASGGTINFDDENLVTKGSVFVTGSGAQKNRTYEIRAGGRQEIYNNNDFVHFSGSNVLFVTGALPGGNRQFYIADQTESNKKFVLVGESGNVGIGINAPTEKLDVAGNIHASGTITSGNSITLGALVQGSTDTITASGGTINFDDENLVTKGSVFVTGSGAQKNRTYEIRAGGRQEIHNNNDFVHFSGSNVAFVLNSAEFGGAGNDEFFIAVGNTGNIKFILEGTTGNVGIGTTTPGAKLDVNGDVCVNGNITVTSNTGAITAPAFFTAVSSCSSDRRLKDHIKPIAGGLDKVTRLRGVSFQWRRDEFPKKNFRDGQQIGLIAQEVAEVLPEVVVTDPDGYKGIQYGKIVAVLVEAIKEQQQIINSTRSELGDLKQRLAAVERAVGVEEKPQRANSAGLGGALTAAALALAALVGFVRHTYARKVGAR